MFQSKPLNQQQIEKLTTKTEYILNNKINNWVYDEVDQDKRKIGLINLKYDEIKNLKIPENYVRFQKLLDVDFQTV